MLVYFFIFLIPILLYSTQDSAPKRKFDDYIVFSIIAIILIGFRYNTGGDWNNYHEDFISFGKKDYFDLFTGGAQNLLEISHSTLFWILHYLEPEYGYYIYHVIAISLGFYALYLFAKEQPYFWLTIALSVPFFVLVMIMGYTRQGIAISFIMIGLHYLKRYQIGWFGSCIAIATTFHASAIAMSLIALPYIFQKNFRYKIPLIISAFTLGLFFIGHLQNYLDKKTLNYVEQAMFSAGTLPRILITILAALFLLKYTQKWRIAFNDYPIWQIYAFAAFATLPALLFLPSTSVDRMALYLLPLQLAVWPRIIYLSKPRNRQLLAFGIIGGYTLTLFVWLNYAKNIGMWLPFDHLFLN